MRDVKQNFRITQKTGHFIAFYSTCHIMYLNIEKYKYINKIISVMLGIKQYREGGSFNDNIQISISKIFLLYGIFL